METAPEMENQRLRDRVAALEERLSTMDCELAAHRQGCEPGSFAPLLSPAPVSVFINYEDRLIYVNPAALKLLRATHADQVLGHSPLEFIVQDLRDIARSRIQNVLSSDTMAPVLEERFVRLDGTIAEVEVAAWRIPYRDSHAVLVSFIEISERRQAEAALRQSEERIEQQFLELEHLYRTAPVGLLLVDTELRYVRINERMAAINGAPADAHLGKTLWEVVPDIASTVVPHYQTVITTGEPIIDVQVRGRTRATPDRERFYKVSYHPVRDAARNVVGVTGVVEDITDQKQAEEALSRRQREFETLVENSPDVIARYAPGLYCLYINRALKRVSGFDPEQVIGRTLEDAGFPEEALAVWHPPVAAAFATGKEQSIEFAFPGASGLRHYQSRIVPERGDSGTIESVLAITEDITERKEGEEALRHSNDELRQANAELDEFAYVASHDLREPLRMVNVYSQLLLKRHTDAEDGEAKKFADFVREGVSRMEALIGDALSYSRAVHEDTPAHPVSLNTVLRAALASISEQVDATSAVITSGPLADVMGDDPQLAVVFENLLSNALTYRKPDETPYIHVSAYRQNGECIVSVSDNGIGFKQQYADRIFGLFKRLHKDEYPGTGLGLAICRRIIGRFGGRIWAESAGEGSGATFFFALRSAEITEEHSSRHQTGSRALSKPGHSKAELYSFLVRGLRSRAIFLTDPEGRITSWHPGVEHLLGYTESEWIGQSASIIFTAEDLANKEFDKEMQEAVRAGEAADVWWHQKKDGSLIFIDGVLVCLRDETGGIVGFSKLMRDATDAKLAEEAVRRSEERLRFAQEGAQLGIWDWDVPSNVVTRSDIHYRLFGHEPRTGGEDYAHWLSDLHPDDRTRVDEENRSALKTGEMESEFRTVWPDGQVRWVHARGKVYFEDGKPLRMVRIVRDITHEKVAEQALADSEARKTAIVNASLDAVLVMDGEGILQEFNLAAENMFGYERGEAIGQSLGAIIVPPHLREAHQRGLARYLQTGEAKVLGKRIEIQAMRADGTEFPVELAIVRVPVTGAPIFAGYVRDITERKRSEDALRRSNEQLAEFAHVVSHDLQTPLRTVRSYTQLLAKRYEGQLDATADTFISHVVSGTKTMEVLIKGLLEYAIAGGEAPREEVDLDEVVQNVVGGLRAQIEEAGAGVTYDDLPRVSANPLQMQQLFQNLIGNAVKYRRPEVAPDVRIRSESRVNQWFLSVADNGEGIPMEHQERIFAPLSRLHGQDVPGTGLGLAVCKKIVEQLGGRIWVESQPGRGSTFHFSLPAASSPVLD